MTAALDPTARLLQELLIFAVMPLWLLAGFGDWLLHRWQRIEERVGWREPALHLLMVGEIAVGLAAALLLQITTAVLALLFASRRHRYELTGLARLSYASARRPIAVAEQWVHALQIVIPSAALAVLAVIHRDELGAIVRSGKCRLVATAEGRPLAAGAGAAPDLSSAEPCWSGFRSSRNSGAECARAGGELRPRPGRTRAPCDAGCRVPSTGASVEPPGSRQRQRRLHDLG